MSPIMPVIHDAPPPPKYPVIIMMCTPSPPPNTYRLLDPIVALGTRMALSSSSGGPSLLQLNNEIISTYYQ